MKIRNVFIHNLNSLRLRVQIDFVNGVLGQTNLFAITGDTGAGKTTILDALTLALYGKIHRNKEVKEALSYGAAEGGAGVEFETDQGVYYAAWNIRRARKQADGAIGVPERELSKWNEKTQQFEIIAEKVREVDTKVEEVTGLDFDRFCRSVLLSQGDFAAFLKAGEKERSELLERITGADIYSRLSMAAFEKRKLEEIKLTGFKKDLEALQLADTETLTRWEQEQQDATAESIRLKEELEILTANIRRLQQKTELLERQQVLAESAAQLENERSAAQPDLEKLERHHLAQPFVSDLARLEDTRQAIAATAEEIARLKEQAALHQAAQQRTNLELADSENALQTLETEIKALQPRWEEAARLDVQLEEKTALFNRQQTALEQAAAERQENSQLYAALEERLQALEQQLEKTEKWLAERSSWAFLAGDLPEIELRRDQLSGFAKSRTVLEQKINTQQKSYKEAGALKEAAEQEVAELQAGIALLQETFKKNSPEQYAQSRNDLLRLLTEEIRQLNDKNRTLLEFKELMEQYTHSLTEFSNMEELVMHREALEEEINKRLMSSMEAVEEAKERQEFKEQVYKDQLVIANYEKDREHLAEGQPCPLCFSIHHPFREGHVRKPFVDQAKQELEVINRQYELLKEQHQKLLSFQNEITLEIQLLRGDELKQRSGDLDKRFQEILSYEEKIARIAPELSDSDYALPRAQLLQTKVAEVQEAIVIKRVQLDKLDKLNTELESKERLLGEKNHILNERATELKILETELRNTQAQQDEVVAKLAETQRAAQVIFEKYNLPYQEENLMAGFDRLRQQAENWQKCKERLASDQSEREATERERRQVQKQGEHLSAKYEQLLAAGQADREAFEQLTRQRFELLGDRNPVIERAVFGEKATTQQQQTEALRKSLNEVSSMLESDLRMEKAKTQEHLVQSEKATALETQLDAAAQQAGFLNPEDLKEALLPLEERLRIEALKAQLAQNSLELQEMQKQVAAALSKLGPEADGPEDLEVWSATQTAKTAQYDGLQQLIGGLNQKLAFNEQQKRSAQQLLQTIAGQEKELGRWAKLNELIGQADGKKFRVFAQSLTLQKLTSLANLHLNRLNGRYLIRKRNGEDLELEIVDTFQADNRRSMNTLSGGESFVVSLALALGLSDLAGRHTSIRSLFIDEGFGALDDNSLDLVVTTLENLQASGKTIGVISHVKAVKERIATQIQVKKSGNGFSELAIVG